MKTNMNLQTYAPSISHSPLWEKKGARTINEIIIHCSATEAGKEYSVAEIDRWHRKRGFQCIGYHYVIHLDGSIEPGRPESMIGAHCIGHNSNSIGICYIGGLLNHKPFDTRTVKQKAAIIELINQLKRKYPAINKIQGHRDTGANKACPCFDAIPEYSHLMASPQPSPKGREL